MTTRSYNNITATLSYDALDHFTQWNAGSTNFKQTVYDANGNRVLLRSTTSTSTTMTVYAFGLQEHGYSGSGSLQSSTYYYSLAGGLLGKSDGTNTTFYLLDSLGSVLMSFNNTANSASLKGSQVYRPYGKRYDHNGTIGTSRGFTGQYNDALTGLDYYQTRYYDNVVGLFLSADTVQGNLQGRNPYAYVDGNPETHSDPTGQLIISVVGVGGGGASGRPSTGATQQSTQVSSTDPCLVQSCGSTVLANTGSIWATNSTLGATACLALAPCFHVSVPTVTYHLVDTFTPLTYCTLGCGEGGDENSLEAESEQKAEIIANEIKAFEAASPGDAGSPADETGAASDETPPVSAPRTLYHYTSEKGLVGILQSDTLNPSTEEPNITYGPGQYFTDIAPEQIIGSVKADLTQEEFDYSGVRQD